jgi:four helix bundle protein
MIIKYYQELEIWQKSRVLVNTVYKYSQQFPEDERYGLLNQIRRSAVSIACNIAEGFGRNSNKDFRRFLTITRGSLFELQTQLYICMDNNFIDKSDFKILYDSSKEIEIMLNAFMRKMKV